MRDKRKESIIFPFSFSGVGDISRGVLEVSGRISSHLVSFGGHRLVFGVG